MSVEKSLKMKMDEIVDLVKQDWHGKPPVKSGEIDEVEALLGIGFPSDYKNFLNWSNGGEARIGSAYFVFWPLEDIYRRNISASIFQYMTTKFIGFGTNGGGECYAFDYTKSCIPEIAIVPLGDLDIGSTHVIAASLTEVIRLARDGQFDDGEYHAEPVGERSDELFSISMVNLRTKAARAWQMKDYQRFVALLDTAGYPLTNVELKKLDFAKSRL